MTFVATAAAVRHCGATPVLADIIGPHDFGVDPEDVERRITTRTKAVCAVHYGGYAAAIAAARALRRARAGADRGCGARPDASGPELGLAQVRSASSRTRSSPAARAGCSPRDDADVAARPRLRSHAMTTGTWDRHRGHAAGYDVVGLGYNYRLDEPRAALLIARLRGLEDDIARRRELVLRYRELLRDGDGLTSPTATVTWRTARAT